MRTEAHRYPILSSNWSDADEFIHYYYIQAFHSSSYHKKLVLDSCIVRLKNI